MRRYQLSCLLWKSLVIWYAVYSHQKMAQTVSPLTAIVTLMWLDLKTAAANSLPTKAGNLANAKCVRLDISFKTPSHTGLQTTQLVFVLFFFHSKIFVFLTLYLFLSMYLCNLFSFFGLMFPKMFVLCRWKIWQQFPAATPLALVLKQFLADRTLDQSYSGGLSSYCLVSRVPLH